MIRFDPYWAYLKLEIHKKKLKALNYFFSLKSVRSLKEDMTLFPIEDINIPPLAACLLITTNKKSVKRMKAEDQSSVL